MQLVDWTHVVTFTRFDQTGTTFALIPGVAQCGQCDRSAHLRSHVEACVSLPRPTSKRRGELTIAAGRSKSTGLGPDLRRSDVSATS